MPNDDELVEDLTANLVGLDVNEIDGEGEEIDPEQDSSDDEEVNLNGYRLIAATKANVNVVINGARGELLKNAKEDIKRSLQAARKKLKLGEKEKPLSFNPILQLMLPFEFLFKLLNAVNRALPEALQLTLQSLENSIKVLLFLHLFKCSPSSFFRNKFLKDQSKNYDQNLFGRFLKGISYSKKNEFAGDHWQKSQKYDSTITNAAAGMSVSIV